jgi:DNA-binding SARP family transcriptional activator
VSDVRILRTRLLPPRLPASCVARPRLEEEVRRGLEGRLVGIVAGAGYGKTTLLAQVVERETRPWAWCSCDARLVDAASLLAHIAAAVDMRFPGAAAGLDLSGAPEDAVADLSNALLETLPEDLVLVLDDVHTLPAPAREAVGLLAEALPDTVHLAVAGREALPVTMSRLRAGRLIEIGEGELSLTEAEAEAVIESLGRGLPEADRSAVVARTEGWPAGVIMAVQAGGRLGGRSGAAADFEYLAEEVLQQQDERVQRFMVGTAALGRFSAGLAEAVTGMADAADIARDLVRRHLFTVSLDDDGEWFRYHHLLRDVLRRRAGAAGEAAVRAQHRRAAAWWAAAGEPLEAVPHLLRAGDHEAAVDLLEPVAERLTATEHAETLAQWLDEIPRERWEARPALLLAHAALLLTRAHHEASFSEYEDAMGRFLGAGEDGRAAEVLVRLQQSMVTAGTRPLARIGIARPWVERLDGRADLAPVTRVLLATSYGYGAMFDEAREQIDAVREATGNPMVRVLRDVAESFYVRFWQGSPRAAMRQLEDAIAAMPTTGGNASLLLTARMLACYVLNELGRFEEARVEADELTEVVAHGGWGRRAIQRAGNWLSSTALAGAGRWEELRQRYEPPPRSSSDAYPTCYAYRYRVPAALLAAHDGDAAEVRLQIEAARADMARFGRAFDDASFVVDFAHAAHVAGLADLAGEQARDALAIAREIASPWLRALAALALVESGSDAVETDRALAEALALDEEHGLEDAWRHRGRRVAVPALLRCMARALGPPGAAERALLACGPAAVAEAVGLARDDPALRARLATLAGDAPGADIAVVDALLRDPAPAVRDAARLSWNRLRARPRAALRIASLGHLTVSRDGVPVPDSGYARPRARALLACILAEGGRAHREALCERLWGDLAPERAAAALRTTLHELRRAIEPELDAGDPASFIAADAEWVRLAFAESDEWDAAELRRIAAAATSPEGHLAELRAAESLVHGPFLEEWPYEDWAEAARSELQALAEDLAERLAHALSDAGDHRGAILRLQRLVARDPEREGWHRALMRAYRDAGERALALRQFHACRTALRREQGVEPDAETRHLYRSILADDDAPTPVNGLREGTVTIVFTDIEASTETAARLGDRRWVEVLAEHDRVVRGYATAHGGREVKSQGDGLMLAFPSARAAVDFGVAVQRDLDARPLAGERLRVRIGLHTGEAVRVGDDLLGRAVITAARIADACAGGEIGVSELVHRLVDSAGDLEFESCREVRLKGLGEPERVHLVRWRDAGVTGQP